MCVRDIAMANQEVATKLVNNININALSSKIDNEEDIEKVASCVWSIAGASKEVANEIINPNPKLRDELQKRMSKL